MDANETERLFRQWMELSEGALVPSMQMLRWLRGETNTAIAQGVPTSQ